MIKRLLSEMHNMYLAKKWNIHESAAMLGEQFVDDYRKHRASYLTIFRVHQKGFSYFDWAAMYLTDQNYKKYLSTVDYFARHPFNGEFTKWIDDKLTLKYLCNGTILDKYFPRYYFMISKEGEIMALPDYKTDKVNLGVDAIIDCVKKTGVLCLKQIAGRYSGGLYKLEYRDEKYFLSREEKTEEEVKKMLGGLRNYLVIEFLKPHPDMSLISPYSTPSVRYLSGRLHGEPEAKMLVSFVEYGGKKRMSHVYCYVDENGYYKDGHYAEILEGVRRVVTEHPDTGAKLQGRIPHWEEIGRVAEEFRKHFPQLIYLGFDFVVTDKDELKILEINSLSGLPSLQKDQPLYEKKIAEYYKNIPRR